MNRDEITGAAASAVDRLAQTGRETYQDVKGRAVDAASRTASAAKAEALDRAETAKDTIADEGRRLADSLRAQGGDDSVQAKVLNVVADSVSDLSESLRGRSFSDLLSEAQGFARRNPGAFVAAAAVAGFALARFARASAPDVDASTSGLGAAPSYGSGSYGMAGGMAGATSGGMGGSGVSNSSLTTHDEVFDDAGFDDAGEAMGGAGIGGVDVDSDRDRTGSGAL